jgi:hypothetical protein
MYNHFNPIPLTDDILLTGANRILARQQEDLQKDSIEGSSWHGYTSKFLNYMYIIHAL